MGQLEYFTQIFYKIPFSLREGVQLLRDQLIIIAPPEKSVHILNSNITAGSFENAQEACRPRPADQRRSGRTGARNKLSW